WITLVIAPVLLLLLVQVQFLPFHSSFVTWTQRIVLLVDLVLLGWLWRRVLSGHELGAPLRDSWSWPVSGITLSLGVLLFSWTVAIFPGEWQGDNLPSWRLLPSLNEEPPRIAVLDWLVPKRQSIRDWIFKSDRVSLRDWVFNSPVGETSRRRAFPFSN